MKQETHCVLCLGCAPLVFDVAASSEKPKVFTVYAYCDCGRIYSHEFVDGAPNSSQLLMRFIAKALSRTKVEVIDLLNGQICIHDFDLNDDDVCCEYHDEADGYELREIKKEIAERTAALITMTTI